MTASGAKPTFALHLGIGNGITVRHPIVKVDGKVVLKDRYVLV